MTPPDTKDATPAVKRREFLKVLGVSTAATAAVGCSSGNVEKLIPYLVSPDNTVPGVSNYYATTCRECAAGCGLIVEVRDGRAIKAEGNPEHPVNRGALCARGQSGLQGLYNPDRFRQPMKREGGQLVPTTWDDAIRTLATGLAAVRAADTGSRAIVINQHEQGSFPRSSMRCWRATASRRTSAMTPRPRSRWPRPTARRTAPRGRTSTSRRRR
jgi:anaerobic selenocysteine-containing dehydrogenase